MIDMPVAKARAKQSVDWIVCGWRLFRTQTGLWLGMALIYLVLAILVRRIPFLGDLVLILVSPMLLVGTLLTARRVDTSATIDAPVAIVGPVNLDCRSSPAPWQGYLLRPAQSLLQAFTNPNKLPAALVVGVLVLGLVMFLKIALYFLVGGSLRAGFNLTQVIADPRLTSFMAVLAVTGLYLILTMALYFLAHLSVFAEYNPMSAMTESFNACRQNLLVLSAFTAAYVLPYLLIGALFRVSPWLGYLSVFTLGLVVLPNFILGTYCSYKDLYESDHAQLNAIHT
jgi:hypothetical protein